MLFDNEVIMLILGTGVFYYALFNKSQIRRIPAWKWLLGSFFLMLTGWLFTILEGFFLANTFNLIEHFSYAAGGLAMVVWCRKFVTNRKEGNQ